METVIKQTEDSMTRKLTNASRLHEDYRPLKAEVDLLRRQCLGLERLPDLHEEEGSPITPEWVPSYWLYVLCYTASILMWRTLMFQPVPLPAGGTPRATPRAAFLVSTAQAAAAARVQVCSRPRFHYRLAEVRFCYFYFDSWAVTPTAPLIVARRELPWRVCWLWYYGTRWVCVMLNPYS